MAEYRDSEEFIQHIEESDLPDMEKRAVIALVRHMPAADVVEVVHGRWVMTLYATTSKRGRVISNKKFACSECGYSNGRKKNNYCPNCGTKMDGERKEAE